MKKTILIGLLLSTAMAFSQDATLAQRKQTKTKTPAVKHVGEFGNIEGVTARQLKDYLYFVASDEMEGRDTPSRGLDLTAKFIAMNLSRWGLKPAGTNESFFQKIPLYRKQLLPDQTSAAVNGQSFKIGEDFIAQLNEGEAGGRLVYVGHGMVIKSRNIDAYRGVDVKDKVLVAADAYPKGVTRADFRGKIGVDFDTPASYARAHGAKGVIVIPNSSALNFWEQRYKSSLNPSRPAPETAPNGGVPIIVASLKMVEAIFQGEKLNYEAIKKNMEEATLGEAFDLSPDKKAVFKVGVKTETLMTQNVVAVLEGGDPQLKDEYVAIGAHYDHVGVSSIGSGADKIFNGADDDGSGTVAALAIAEALAQGPKPKRSVLFVWHAGEEKGLWGSAYIADNPPVPIRQIITQLNIDMIGRSKKEGDTNPRNTSLTGPNEIYVIGSKMMSTELGEVSESVNKSFLNLKFNYKYDAPNDPERFFYRSDHYNYAKKGIPIIFYFSGVHEDYHQPTDHADKIDYAKMEKVTRTVLATLWKLANATDRPKVDKPLPPQLAGY